MLTSMRRRYAWERQLRDDKVYADANNVEMASKTMINWFSRCTDSWIQTDVEVDGGRMQSTAINCCGNLVWRCHFDINSAQTRSTRGAQTMEEICRHFVHLHRPKHLSSGHSTIGECFLRRIHEANAHVMSYMHWPKSTAGGKLRRRQNWNVFALRSIFPIHFYAFSHCAFSTWFSPRCALHSRSGSSVCEMFGICIRIPHTDLLISDIVFVIAVCWQSHTNRCVCSKSFCFLKTKFFLFLFYREKHRIISVIFPIVCESFCVKNKNLKASSASNYHRNSSENVKWNSDSVKIRREESTDTYATAKRTTN